MQSACLTGKRVFSLAFVLFTSITVWAQDNSPLSRYGLGDIVPSANIVNRGMGHASAAYNDYQTINFLNPASYRRLAQQRAILDIALDINNRRLSNNQGVSYTSNNAIIPYVAAAFQLKGEKSKKEWGIAFGLRPLTRVSYNIETGQRMRSGDSVLTNFEGNGGLYQAFAGTGFGIGNLSIGINTGYRFGSKDYTTRVRIFNDTSPARYTSGQQVVRNNFGGAFLEAGLQYQVRINKKSSLDIGAYGSLQTSMRATRDDFSETYLIIDDAGSTRRLDSVKEVRNVLGTIDYPLAYGFGLMYDFQGKSKLNLMLDYAVQNWADYRYYGTADFMRNSWQVRTGAQLIPNVSGKAESFWAGVVYRAGFYFAKEPYTVMGDLNTYGITLGAGLPIRKFSYAEFNRNNIVNLSLEFGQRGNRSSLLRENFFRLAAGFSLSDIWFIKRKYD